MGEGDNSRLEKWERDYPGIGDQIERYQKAELPPCPRCGSESTAVVGVGAVGRAILLSSMCSKYKLIGNGPKPGEYFCNSCQRYFDDEKNAE
jgi:hypothetical protein